MGVGKEILKYLTRDLPGRPGEAIELRCDECPEWGAIYRKNGRRRREIKSVLRDLEYFSAEHNFTHGHNAAVRGVKTKRR